MKMSEVIHNVEIPEGIQVDVQEHAVIILSKDGKSLRKRFVERGLHLEKKGNGVQVKLHKDTRRLRALKNTIEAKVNNMIVGLEKGFTYKLAVVHAHFPITLNKKGNSVEINNYLGEKNPRHARILEGVDVQVKGKEILVKGMDVDAVGQTAANLEQATRQTKKDPRVFQDGIYLVERSEGM
ncbi:MAG: 50S ribosomal protein L6 [Candidatus Diapherotrites archaeon]|nr:50S ribosomal protein L6 [Candidatus Diapherotrites archaeon]